MPEKATAYFCPSCQSATVNTSVIEGGSANCSSCGWRGDNKELLGYQFEHDFSNPEAVFHSFVRDIRHLLAANGTGVSLGQMLIKWGFVSQKDMNVKTLSRYVGACARGIVSAVFEERRRIEKERVSVS